MKTKVYIDKARKLRPSQDYELLRREGLRYIENLAHKLWTDYNEHDPGITILEVLCYAITELGYRTNFDIKNLLSNTEGKIENKSFFTPKQILTNAPLTLIDYRKLLIDIEGVNNAWIIHAKQAKDEFGYNLPLDNEVPIYINKKEDKLSLSDIDKYGNSLNRLSLRGLNNVVVELSDDVEFGELNDVFIEYAWLDEKRYVEVEAYVEFDSWNHPKTSFFKFMSTASNIEIKSIEELKGKIKIQIERTTNTAQNLVLYLKTKDEKEWGLVKQYFENKKNVCEIIYQLEQKRKKVFKVFEKINTVLKNNRNLTEDWLCTDTIKTVDIGICADMELKNGFDAEEILVHVHQIIDDILSPPIAFYTLEEMLDMNKSPRTIFSGPSLKHGFLLDEEVSRADLVDCIHASDIIAALLDIPGVQAVKNLLLTAYDSDGKPIEGQTNEPWCLHLQGNKKPVFDYRKSKLLLFRDGIPFIIPEEGGLELSQGIVHLKTQNNSLKLNNTTNDFVIPDGRFFQLDEYYSIQNDFPETYKIGEGQLLNTSSNLRKAQAKQLKAYLQHFDQLLGDFFNQLYHAKDVFDLEHIDKTYFPKYIDTISGIDESLFADEVYSKDFQNLLLEGEKKTDRSLYESESTYFDRRNRTLDHLMARFGESFNDYVLMTHKIQQNTVGLAELTLQHQELIDDKQRFLKRYPEISYARGLALNYSQELSPDDIYPWGLKNRGGYEKRVAALLGINSINLGNIVDENPKKTWTYHTDIGELKFKLLNTTTENLAEKWDLTHQLIHTINAYRTDSFTKTYIYIVNKDGQKMAKLETPFDSKIEAQDYIPKLYQALNSYLENFYLLEHILLRPLVTKGLNDEDLLTVCLNEECYSYDDADPYSFKATVVLPGWLARFRNRYFRDYAERLFREEAPAHCLLKICWVGQEDMLAFQQAYKAWIKNYQKLKLKYCTENLSETFKTQYNKALSELVSTLKALNTVYDEGTLYDCKESELDNPIILNNSSLGTLKNIKP